MLKKYVILIIYSTDENSLEMQLLCPLVCFPEPHIMLKLIK